MPEVRTENQSTVDKKPGIFSRLFSILGRIGRFLRSAINLLFLILFLVIIGSLFTSNIKPLPAQAFLRVAPSGVLVEQLSYSDPLSQLAEQSAPYPSETLLPDLVEAIDKAGKDPRITGLSLELDHLVGGGLTKLSVLGQAIARFKESGKPVIASASNYSQEQYYLATFADEIHLNPMGMVMLTGYGAYRSYFRDAAEKLGVNFHVFKVGEFKDAVEPFTRNDMSESSRLHTQAWLEELWLGYTSQVENNRQLPAGAIDLYINDMDNQLTMAGGDLSKLALEAGLVDHINPLPAMVQRLQELAGIDADDKHDYLAIGSGEYLFHKQLKPETREKPQARIGVIVASGTIHDGEQFEGNIGSATLGKLLQKSRDDKDIKALVVRIDSPGGSAFASDVIREEIELTRAAGKPVVISMGSVAASGGYWIAAGADQIWAAPTTLTGSIGVFGLIPTFENTFGKLGIHSDGIGTSTLADIYRLDRPLSSQASRIIQLSVESIYDRFLDLVVQGRELSRAQVAELAEGRVWTGAQAQRLGLVDELGNLGDAIAAAAALAGLDAYDIKPVERELNFQEQLLRQLTRRVAPMTQWLTRSHAPADASALLRQPMRALEQEAHWLAEKLGILGRPGDPTGIYLECIECRLF